MNHFITRLIFCFFAENTHIFPEKLFTETLRTITRADGSRGVRQQRRTRSGFKTKREAMAYYNALDLYTQQQMRVFKRSPKHYVVCNPLEWLHFYGG